MATLEKKRATELINRVRSFLWNEWDPIGLQRLEDAEKWPDDEYDGYAPHIAGMIWHERTIGEIADYLDWAANVHMGMPGDPKKVRERHEHLAARLLELRLGLE